LSDADVSRLLPLIEFRLLLAQLPEVIGVATRLALLKAQSDQK